ncbi:hypothetical protein V202x_46140 [Gimesia aquarii]|uniref:DUF304 domain-containing protein n=1 Tax=Gimesia aquarii TaxID=2527964 RepID=A0A517X117_9PLAN|nr:hypothetical protein V202x_46140 [Gimesia aquarii]
MNDDRSAERTYYFRYNPLYLGVLSGIFWFLLGTASVLVAYLNPDGAFKNPQKFILFCTTSYSVMILLSIWLVLSYYRERLVITDSTITLHGVFRKKTFFLSDITRLIWFTRFGKIILESPQGQMKLSQGKLTDFERAEIVAFLYDSVDQKLQVDWSKFIKKCVPIWGGYELLTHPSLFVACVIPDIHTYTQSPEG